MVLTGASGGLGETICQTLAKQGVKLCMIYGQSRLKAEAQLTELPATGHEALITQADIATQDGIESIYVAAKAAFGGIDILVLDVAYNESIPFQDLETLNQEKKSKTINFKQTAQYVAVRSVVPYLKQRGGGRTVTVSSVGGNLPASSSIAYPVSKAGPTPKQSSGGSMSL